jgi:ATP-dependent Lhr-like helicase
VFHPATDRWFTESFGTPTPAQQLAWPPIASGKRTLLLAPTGSGKTLAAFLVAIDRLMFRPPTPPTSGKPSRKVKVLYISPLKALGVDVDRNLRAPLAGIRAVAERDGIAHSVPSVGVRSGDTPQAERLRIARDAPDILITTPESLYLLLTSRAREILDQVDTVIIDEIHVLVPSKRGTHLFLSLERLERLRKQAGVESPLQRIGLSATQRPLDEVARLLGGGDAPLAADASVPAREVEVVDASRPKPLELTVEVPVEDMARLGEAPLVESGPAAGVGTPSIWPSIHPRLVKLIRSHRSTMIFVNSRRLAERLAQAINELAGEEIALAHHGSVAKDKRAAIEDRLKRGQLPAIVATSSLELGIDMGAVDLVIQIEAPPSVASGLQRIGRSAHHRGGTSRGVVFPKYRGDLVACAAATGRMLAGEVESTFYPRNPLDVLAQQIVAMVSVDSMSVDELFATVRSAAPYAELSRGLFESVLDLLSGRYPSDEFAELRPRISWDRLAGVVSPRKGAQRIAILNGGTIPDRGLYGVFLQGEGDRGGSRVGELDEEMVFETQTGDVFLLGASSWRVLEITRDRVTVAPAPGEPGKMPFWRGDGPGRPLEFGRAIGRLTHELASAKHQEAQTKLESQHALEPQAAKNLLQYLADQREATELVPSDRTIVVESFLDEIGDWRVALLSPFGARVHAPWAIAVAARLRAESIGEIDFVWSDDGLVFRLPQSDGPPPVEWFLPRSDEVEEQVTRQLGSTAMFAARFRENAARALLLPRRRPDRRTPLWMQRRRAADLLSVAAQYPAFPLLLETYRECLRDVFDLPGLVSILADIERRAIGVHTVDAVRPSPFAASLMFAYTGTFLYEGDAPLAERRAQALTLDHAQLRELLGSADMRELLDVETIATVASELQMLAEPQVKHADGVHDMLLRIGPLSADEIEQRVVVAHRGELADWLTDLVATRRVLQVPVGGRKVLAAAEDAARLRDALGVNPPPGLPSAFLDPVADPLGDLVSRYARTHAPFTAAAVATHLGIGEAPILDKLKQLLNRNRVVEGEFLPGARGREWCDAEVLRTIKRRSLAKLRKQVEAVDPVAYARFLPHWQGLDRRRRGLDGLLDVVEQLQGYPLPASSLEQHVLPTRLEGYAASDLDQLCLAGEIVWRGVDSLGAADGRIALYLADDYPLLAPPVAEVADPLAQQVADYLRSHGASFFDAIAQHLGAFPHDVVAALWQLVWAGQVTNDTLAPLRTLGGSQRATRARGRRSSFRSRRAARLPGSDGRWSLLPTTQNVSSTQRGVRLAHTLLARQGIVMRGGVSRELVAGGFAAVYPVLKQMEESGKVRRGYFVAGQGGAQFAAPGASELVRAKSDPDEPDVWLLAATDPANAYGAALPWPEAAAQATGPQRAAGARVVLLDGRLVAWVNRNASAVTTFLPEAQPDRGIAAQAIADALARIASRGEGVLLAKVDGQAVMLSELAEPLAVAGFARTHRGVVHRGEPTL